MFGEPAKVGLENDGPCTDNMYGRILTQDQLLTLAAQKGAAVNSGPQSVVFNNNEFVAIKNNNQTRIDARPLLKLSVNLIKTYKHINEVSERSNSSDTSR